MDCSRKIFNGLVAAVAALLIAALAAQGVEISADGRRHLRQDSRRQLSSVASTDPNFARMATLDSTNKVQVYFTTNATHASFRVSYAAQGYVCLGVGSGMAGAYFIMGLDATLNPGKSSVALYRQSNDYSGVPTVIAAPAQLNTFGILAPSYTSSAAESSLRFTVLLSAQQSTFKLVDSAGVNVVFSAGAATYQEHTVRGVLIGQDFISGNVGTVPPPVEPAPLPDGATASSDPDYDFQTEFDGLVLFSRKNATHGSFRLSRSSSNGYIALGTGGRMVGSTSIVAMDPSSNPGYASFGVYRLNSKVGSSAQVMSKVADSAADLYAQFGILDASFVTTEATSDMRFVIELAKQTNALTFLPGPLFNEPADCIYAAGPTSFGFHGTFGLTTINFATGGGGIAGVKLNSGLSAHIAFMIMAWEIFVPAGILVPLFNNIKHGVPPFCGLSAPSWFKFHWVALTFGVFSGFIGTITAYMFIESKNSAHWSTSHKKLGLAILLGSIAQPLWGRFRPKKPRTGEVKSRARELFEQLHPSAGYLLYLLGLINCLLGVPELYRVLGGQKYIFGTSRGTPGFSGAMGTIIILLFAMYILITIYGFMRSYVNNKEEKSSSGFVGNDQMALSVSNPKFMQSEPQDDRTVTLSEVANHKTDFDCWVIYKGKAYDVSSFLTSHPGGKRALVQYAGQDITATFDDIGHSQNALSIMARHFVGVVGGNDVGRFKQVPSFNLPTAPSVPSSVPDESGRFLSGDNQIRRQVKVIEKTPLSHNVFLIRFGFPSTQMVLGLPHGKHISMFAPAPKPKVRGHWNGRPDPDAGQTEIQRKYTPVSNDANDTGYFTLVIKVYRPDASSGMIDGGKMSRYIDNLNVGSLVQIAGPVGSHEYLGKGKFMDAGRQMNATQIAMVAGGSGITPIYQLARAMLEDPNDPCRISILYANSTVNDVLLKPQLDELESLYPKRIQIWHTISQEPPSWKPWKYSVGRINKEMLQKRFPPPGGQSLVISCGPQPMTEHVTKLLKQIGFSERQILEF